MLSDFFSINLPYGIARNEDGAWCAFNREYQPLGWNQSHHDFAGTVITMREMQIFTTYTGLTEKFLLSIADRPESVDRNAKGEITRIWLYNDKTNPVNQSRDIPELWEQYFFKLKRLGKLQRKRYY